MSAAYLLVDIEGTTTSVSFVYETLFPFFIAHLRDYTARYRDDPEFQEHLATVRTAVYAEAELDISTEEAVEMLIEWTREDRKHTTLKTVQGEVWREGYASGALKGHVYPDVLPALERCRRQGLRVGVYSSGSVYAQQLLFGHSEAGNLLPYFSDHFDTQVGHKREPASYSHIAAAVGVPADEILFLSDVEAELDAAQSAGMQTLQIVRPGTVPSTRHATAPDFAGLP